MRRRSKWAAASRTLERVSTDASENAVRALLSASQVRARAQQLLGLARADALRDWRLMAAAIVLGAVAGVVNLYVAALVLGWIAHLFRGNAPQSSLRAAMAWGGGPIAIGLPVGLAAIVIVWLTGALSDSVLILLLDGVIVVLVIAQSCGGFIADFGRGSREGVLSCVYRGDRPGCNRLDCSQPCAGARGPGICDAALYAGRRLGQ